MNLLAKLEHQLRLLEAITPPEAEHRRTGDLNLTVSELRALVTELARVRELETMIENARSEDGVSADDAPAHIDNAGASAWVDGYETGQNSVLRHFAALASPQRSAPEESS